MLDVLDSLESRAEAVLNTYLTMTPDILFWSLHIVFVLIETF